jgi:RNA polymerase sigma-70 factor, ECF subfamily
MRVDATDLFARYAEPVYRYFRRMTTSADVAADLTQEVFLRIVRGLRRYEPRGREAGWVFRIAQSVLAAKYRRTNRPDEVPLSDADALHYEPDRLLAIGFEEALKLLPQTDRQVYLLREQGGLAYDEIADVCGLTKPAVRARLCRARERIRRCLAGRLSTESHD